MLAAEHFLLLLLKPFLIGAFAGVVFTTVNWRVRGESFKITDVLVSISIVLVAYIAGYLTGISGSSAIGNLIPAALAFIGGLNVYLFGGKNIQFRALSIFSAFLFAIVLFYGVLDGGYERERSREGQMLNLAQQELRIRTFRQNLSLPPDPPSWAQ